MNNNFLISTKLKIKLNNLLEELYNAKDQEMESELQSEYLNRKVDAVLLMKRASLIHSIHSILNKYNIDMMEYMRDYELKNKR